MVVNEFNIHRSLIDKFLDSMEKDLNEITYSSSEYDDYIVGSAEVVGLMYLKIFVNGDESMYKSLEDNARSLEQHFKRLIFKRCQS